MQSSDERMPMTIEELRAFVREEVRKALQEEKDALFREWQQRLARDIHMQIGLPSWARMETK